MKFKALYNAFPGAMLASTALFRVRWLEMRVNVGWIFFALWGIFAFILAKRGRFFAKLPDGGGTTANLLVCGLGIFLILGKTRVFSLPAAIIREGLGLPRLPFSHVNTVIAGFLILGWFFLFFTSRKRGQGTSSMGGMGWRPMV
jgi:hypothetical protein